MVFRFNLFWKELILFGLTLLIGVFSAYNQASTERSIVEPLAVSGVEPSVLSWNGMIFFIAFFVILFLIMAKFKRLNAVALKFFLFLVVFSGSQVVIGSIAGSPWNLVWALALTLVFALRHNVIVHDLGIMLGIAGVSSVLGVTVSPEAAVILLVVLSFYDILAVYWTKHMIYLAQGMIESGAIFGFVIPFDFKDMFYHKAEARQHIGEKFMILGSGDIGLPIILASSLAVVSLEQAVITSLFSLAGLFLTHVIFVNQESRKPMAALPPIAMMTIVGYLVAQFL